MDKEYKVQKIRTIRNPEDFGDSIQFYMYRREIGNQKSYIPPVEFVPYSNAEELRPFLTLPREDAQQLMDSLWDCGLRPSEGSGSAGAMKAVQNHLEDMKTIAFHALKIQKE